MTDDEDEPQFHDVDVMRDELVDKAETEEAIRRHLGHDRNDEPTAPIKIGAVPKPGTPADILVGIEELRRHAEAGELRCAFVVAVTQKGALLTYTSHAGQKDDPTGWLVMRGAMHTALALERDDHTEGWPEEG